MKLEKQDVGVWVKASEELSTENEIVPLRITKDNGNKYYDFGHYEADISMGYHTVNCYFLLVYEVEWLKPIKDVYVFTYDELKDFYNDAMDEGEAEANGDGAATFEQFLESIKQ